MYLDQLDTVRFESHRKDLEDNYAFAEAAMMKNIIQGRKITLSQTQLFDSGIILQLLEKESFVHLLEKEVINIALFHKDCSVFGSDLKAIIIDKLKQGIDGDKRNPFYFSGIDGLSKEKIYSDNYQKNIEVPRKMAIELLQSNGKSTLSDFPLGQQRYFESLKNFADVINIITPTVNKQNNMSRGVEKWTMGQFIGLHLRIAEDKYKEYYDKDYIQTLQKLYNILLTNNQDNHRSNYYIELDKNICNKEDVEKIKAIVDFYYNLIVAMSVEDENDKGYELTFDSIILDDVDEKIIDEVIIKIQGNINAKINYSQIINENQEIILPNIDNGSLSWNLFDQYTEVLTDSEIQTIGRRLSGNLFLASGYLYNNNRPVIKNFLTDMVMGVSVGLIEHNIGPVGDGGVVCVKAFANLIIELGLRGFDEAFSQSKLEEAEVHRLATQIRKSLKGDKK